MEASSEKEKKRRRAEASESDSEDSEDERRRRKRAKKERKRKKKEKKKQKKKERRSVVEEPEEEEEVQPLQEASSDEEVGPRPLPRALTDEKVDYGGALRPGEGSAIAQYVQKNMRIPRRGEVGWQGDDIERLENVGYVMSGSRHARMNAVRLRKENQVYSAEEKRALALINFEEKQQKEAQVIADLKEMLHRKLAKEGLASSDVPPAQGALS